MLQRIPPTYPHQPSCSEITIGIYETMQNCDAYHEILYADREHGRQPIIHKASLHGLIKPNEQQTTSTYHQSYYQWLMENRVEAHK
jgi:hypothetical protein